MFYLRILTLPVKKFLDHRDLLGLNEEETRELFTRLDVDGNGLLERKEAVGKVPGSGKKSVVSGGVVSGTKEIKEKEKEVQQESVQQEQKQQKQQKQKQTSNMKKHTRQNLAKSPPAPASHISRLEEVTLEEIFDFIDENGDGFLDLEEVPYYT